MPEALTIGLLIPTHEADPELVRGQLPGQTIVPIPDCAALDEAALLSRLRALDAVAISRASPRIPDALIGNRGRLRQVSYTAGSIRHLVSKALIEDGLLVTNWGDQVAHVAEAALMFLLAGLKQVHTLDAFIRSDWRDDRRVFQDFPATINGRDIGLYGFGPIGRHMARYIGALGAKVAIYDPYAKDVPAGIRVCPDLRTLFATCQCISIHCGLNDGTRGTVTRELLELLPQGAVLVNTARGAIINEADLVAVLPSKRIIACLDVLENEKTWATGALSTIPSNLLLLTGHIAERGKGPDRSKPRPPIKSGLPDHVVAALAALAEGRTPPHQITAAQYDLKT